MVAVGILASDSFQAQLGLHGFCLRCFTHLFLVDAIDDMGTLSLELFDVLSDVLGHLSTAGDDESLIACAALRDELSVLTPGIHQQSFRDIVTVIPGLVDSQDTLDEIGSQFSHGVNRKLHQEFARIFLPHITYGQVNEKVVIGLSHLQKTLTARYIVHEVRGIAPNAVRRTHVDGGVKLPPWPLVVLG